MKRPVTCILLAFLISLPLSAQDSAAVDIGRPGSLPFKPENVGAAQGPGFKAEGVFIGTPLVVDSHFATEHEIPAFGAPFRVTVPKEKNLYLLPGGKKTDTPELVRLTVATDDRKAREILRFVTLTVPLQQKQEDRLVVCANLLRTRAIPQIMNGYEQGRLLETYVTKVHGHDAVCLVGEMVTPGTGVAYWVKTVGILPGNSEHGIMAFLMADKNLSELKTREDLTSKGFAQKVIHSLEFLPVSPAPQVKGDDTGKDWAGTGMTASTSPTGVTPSGGSANSLKDLFQKYHAALVVEDMGTAARMARSLLPDEARLKTALGPGVTPEIWDKIQAFHAKIPMGDDLEIARLLAPKPSQTLVQVHGATTEEIAKYTVDSVAFKEFPGATRDLARTGILKPGMTFFEVEFLEPGSPAGMKYHLFYWDGSAWTMLGPIWRALQAK